MDYTPTCPYLTQVEIQAWGEGLTVALHTDQERVTNPYTSGDTCVAWATGWDDGKYERVPFNPLDIEDVDSRIRNMIEVQVMHDMNEHNVSTGSYLLYAWIGGRSEGKPAWADNRPEHRRVSVSPYNLTRIVRQGVYDQKIIAIGGMELGCPPYTFEYESGGMRITDGPFTKFGTKDEWDGVLTEMREKWEEIPAGLNIEDVNISIYVTAPATASWQTSIEVTSMVENEDGVYMGTEDELQEEVEAAIENLEGHEVDSSWAEVEYEIDDYSVEIEASDITYDLQEVSEV